MYYANQPAVIAIFSKLKDYKRGSLDLQKISSCELYCLQIVESETEIHQAAQEARVRDGN